MMNLINRIILSILVVPSLGFCSEGSDEFEILWNSILQKSHGIQSEKMIYEATEIGEDRASLHWSPRLFLNSQVLSTNDPSTTLFSTLGSRSLQASDLNPNVMNHPDRDWFERGSLTIDLPLYEGGSSLASLQGGKLESKSQSFALQAQIKEEYAYFAQEYAKLLALRGEKKDYFNLKSKLQSLMGRYKLGSKENPVGYSGLLGMKALMNRIESSMDQTEFEMVSIENSIQIKSGQEIKNIQTNEIPNPISFIDSKLIINTSGSNHSSLRVKSLRLEAEAQKEFSKAQRAKWFPKVGFFASGNLTSGPRDTGLSLDYGAYLHWDLFNPRNSGVYKESDLRSAAVNEKVNEIEQSNQITNEALEREIPILKENIRRIDDSLALTAEQVVVTEKLFRDGSINVLQLIEVLSRRVDAVQSKRQVLYAYVQKQSERYLQNVSGYE